MSAELENKKVRTGSARVGTPCRPRFFEKITFFEKFESFSLNKNDVFLPADVAAPRAPLNPAAAVFFVPS